MTQPTTPRQPSKEQLHFIRCHKWRRLRIFIWQLLLGIFFLGLWEWSARKNLINPFIFSSPSRILVLGKRLYLDGSLLQHLWITIYETLLSFALIMGIGIIVAVLLWCIPPVAKICEPYLVILGSLPKTALAPVLIVWLGNNMKTIIVAAVTVAVFGTILTLYHHFKEIDQEKILLIRTLGGGKKAILFKLLLPSSVPVILSNMKVNIGLALVGVIIGEFLAGKKGLGYLIIYGSQVFQLDLVLLSIVLLCILSILLYGLIRILEKHYNKAS